MISCIFQFLSFHREVKEEREQRLFDELTLSYSDQLVQTVTDDLLASLAEETNSLCMKKRILNQLGAAARTLRLAKHWKVWIGRYARRVRLKNTLENFPIAPAMVDSSELLKTLLPSRSSSGIVDDAFFLTKKARLSVEPVTAVDKKRKRFGDRLRATARLVDLKHQMAWKAMDLVAVLTSRMDAELSKTTTKNMGIFRLL